jgi:hypothetical protein
MTTGASANQVTSATILNIANIRIKNNTIVMVSDLSSRHKLHGQIRNKRNIRDMKKSRRKECPVQKQKEVIHQRYEQCNGGKTDAKKKDEQNEKSYERKRQNQDTKDKYLKKERKVVPKWKIEKQ